MSVIVKETAEYVEMSDSITLSIVKDGTAGTSINMKNGVASISGLPSSGASMGDSYIIDGHLWTYTGATVSDSTHVNGFTDCGSIKGEQGQSNYVHVAWCKESDFNISTKKPNSESVIKLNNNDGVTYEYMGTWVSATKKDTNAEAFSKATWVYIKGGKGNKGDNYTIVFTINGINAETLNFDDICEMTDASLQADFFNQGVSVNIPHSTLTCYDADGNVLGSPIDVREASNIVADGGNLYLSSSCKSIVAVAMDAKDSILVSKSLGVIRNTITYGLTKMNDTAATVLASNSTTNATFHLHYNLHYKAVKMVGTVAHEATIASIKATIEGAEKVTTVNGLEGTLNGDGTKTYDASNRPVSSIPVTVTLADGSVLYDSVPVTMEAGVAIDINNNIGNMSVTVKGQGDAISTLQSDGKSISAKVSGMDSGLKATGIDIDAHKVTFTGSQFLWQNNAGAKVAYIDDKGNACFSGYIYAQGGTFTGNITASKITGSTITSTSKDGKSVTKIEGGQVTTGNDKSKTILDMPSNEPGGVLRIADKDGDKLKVGITDSTGAAYKSTLDMWKSETIAKNVAVGPYLMLGQYAGDGRGEDANTLSFLSSNFFLNKHIDAEFLSVGGFRLNPITLDNSDFVLCKSLKYLDETLMALNGYSSYNHPTSLFFWNSSEITFDLGDPSERDSRGLAKNSGRVLFIWQMGARINFKATPNSSSGNSANCIYVGSKYRGVSTWWSGTLGQCSIFFSDGKHWVGQYLNTQY